MGNGKRSGQPTHPNIGANGELVLTPPEVDELATRAGQLMQWFMRRYPEWSASLPKATRSRWAGVCRQIVGEWSPEDINDICLGMPHLYPYAPDPKRNEPAKPIDPFKMRRRAHEALPVGRELRRQRAARQAERERTRAFVDDSHERWQAEAQSPERRAIGEQYLAERRAERERRERARERLAQQREAEA